MAQLYTIRLYYNTGFDEKNRPCDISVINNAAYTDFDSNYLYQQLDLNTTRIKAGWSDVRDVDYVRIGDTYYIVTGVSMLSPQTAELTLQVDPLLSMGGMSQVDNIEGWLTRGHVARADDALFVNTIAEPWQPSAPLVIDGMERLGPAPADELNLVLSTVKLTDIEHVAEVYSTEAGSVIQGRITIPKIPEAAERCTFSVGAYGFVYPAGSVYNYDYAGIKDAINDVRSLGIESAIITAYQIPRNFTTLDAPAGTALIRALANTPVVVTPQNLNYKYGTRNVNNNKVYALYNNYVVLSSCSGDRLEWPAEDIYSGGDSPAFRHMADLSPAGRPYIQPTKYHGSDTVMYQEAVKGEEWYRLPYAYTGASGSRMIEANYSRGLQRGLLQMGEIVASNLGGIDGLAKSVVGVAGGVMDIQASKIDAETRKNIVAPEISFPQEYGAQAYLGNIFYVYRTRLSDQDMLRADNFLTQYGYAQDKALTKTDFYTRQNYNYIKATNVNIIAEGYPLRLRNQCADMLVSGVRLWHVLPTTVDINNNP